MLIITNNVSQTSVSTLQKSEYLLEV